MNMQIFKALSWEIWGKNKPSVLMFSIFLPLTALAAHLFSFRLSNVGISEIQLNHCLAISSLIYIAIVFSYTECSSKSINTGFPPHLFLLPLSTWKLVLTPMILGVSIIVFYGFLWINYILPFEFSAVNQFAILLALSSLLVWLQFINWIFSKNAIKATISLLSSVILIVILCMSALGFLDYRLNQLIGFFGLIICFLLGVAGSIYFVDSCRKGNQGAGIEVLSEIVSAIGHSRGDRTFEIRHSAQFWFEWKTFGWIFPVASFLMAAPLFFASSAEQIIVIFSNYYIVAFALGIAIATPYLGAKTFQMLPLTGILPLSNQELSCAKLKMAFYTLLLGSTFLFIALYASCLWGSYAKYFFPHWKKMVHDLGIINAIFWLIHQFTCAVAIAWIACSAPMVVCLFNKKIIRYLAIVVAAFVFLAGMLLAALTDAFTLSKLFTSFTLLYLLGAISIAGIAAIFLTLRYCQKNNLTIPLTPISWLSITILSSTLLLLVNSSSSIIVTTFYMLLTLSLLVLSILPILITPLAMAKNRHQ